MDPAINTNKKTGSAGDSQLQPKTDSAKIQPVSTSIGKEQEGIKISSSEIIKEISSEAEISKEVEKAGVEQFKETIELPPDVKKLGVKQTGASTSVKTTAASLPNISLPISDQKIIKGVHEKVTDALRWLAVWCFRQLEKAHIKLKIVHGKIIRVRTN